MDSGEVIKVLIYYNLWRQVKNYDGKQTANRQQGGGKFF